MCSVSAYLHNVTTSVCYVLTAYYRIKLIKVFHKSLDMAFNETKESIDDLFKGLKGLRMKIIQQMQTNINSYQGLYQVQLKLSEIKDLIDDRIRSFKNQLRGIYEKHIKQKLHELFQIVQKSQQFLEQQRVRLIKTKNLKPFYLNDLHHDLKYYDSYFQEILEKNIRRFKASFDHDKILKMIVNFQQNLQEIFKLQQQQEKEDRIHLFIGEHKFNRVYQLTNNNAINIQHVQVAKEDFSWEGEVASVFYPDKKCFYLVGQGNKQSNRVQKYLNRQLKPVGRLQTRRKNFAVCLLDHQVYIVGGQNKKQGCLVKCQKYAPSENRVYIVNSLNARSSRHSLSSYKDKFLLKFGGTDQVQTLDQNGTPPPEVKPEIYSTQTQQWRVIDLPDSVNNTPIVFGLYSTIFKTATNQLIILGTSPNSNVNNQNQGNSRIRYLLSVECDEKELKEIKIQQSLIQFPQNIYIFTCKKYNKNEAYFFAKEKNNDEAVIQLRSLTF